MAIRSPPAAGFVRLAHTANTPEAVTLITGAIFTGVQFHPEVIHFQRRHCADPQLRVNEDLVALPAD